ncbi:MAG: hypothetical protein RPS47_08330 [Colwellia sp.]
MTVYIAFCRVEAEEYALIASQSDCIVSPVILECSVAQVICYQDSNNDDKLLLSSVCEKIREQEEGMAKFIGSELQSFTNNFFECSILPIIRIISSIERALKNCNPQGNAEVIFRRKYRHKRGSLKYFLAEHESQGVALYDRAYSLQSIIESWLKSKGVSYKFQTKTQLSMGRVKSILRILVVWSLRFISDLRRVNKHIKAQSQSFDLVVNVRTFSQFEFILPTLMNSKKRVAVLCGRSFRGGSLSMGAYSALRNTDHVVIEYAPNSYAQVFASYFSALPVIFNFKRYLLDLGGLKVDVSTALKEIRVMACELEVYRQSLDLALKDVTLQDGCFLSTEQKSPHANIDAIISHNKDLKCGHLMQCDQLSNDIPYPVFGDVYIVDTKLRLQQFKTGWSTATDKLAYVGTIKNEACTVVDQGIADNKALTVCYFADSDDKSINTAVVERLCLLLHQQKVKQVIIKLHPRDNGGWLKNLAYPSAVKVVNHGELAFEELLNEFDIAISNPSGVVMDLLCKEVPLILCRLSGRYMHDDFPYSDSEFKSNISTINQIDGLLSAPDVIKSEIVQLKRRIIDEGAGESILNLIVKEMLART